MCIIVSKEKGQKLPTLKTLKNCFENNSDGAGFMYVDKGKVIIDKGYMSFSSFYQRLKYLKSKYDLENKALVIHFRIGTSGKGKENLTHPFPLTNKKRELNKVFTKCDVGIVHNGIIKDYEYDEKMSDTQTFIKDFMYPLYEVSSEFYKYNGIKKVLEKETGSKLCILDTSEKITYVGNFIEDKGIMYSNDTYKPFLYTHYDYYGFGNYSWYDNYDWSEKYE